MSHTRVINRPICGLQLDGELKEKMEMIEKEQSKEGSQKISSGGANL